jgi:hypothetical protein
MRVRGGGGRRPIPFVAAVLAALALTPASAGAATVVNGDFEAGDLSGWDVHRVTQAGNWFAYRESSDHKVSKEPIAEQRGKRLPFEPPQGRYAATSDEIMPDTMILSQDIALAPGFNHRLSLLAFYGSAVPIAVPAPDTLAVGDDQLGGQANQQLRIDVVKPGAPIESLDPADVLTTVFRTRPGDPQSMAPTWIAADLSPFAGQTVRLRIANAVHEELFTAGIDAVAVDSVPPGQSLPPLGSSRFAVGKVTLNRRNGTATIAIEVPGPGRLTAKGEGRLAAAPKGREPEAHATKAGKRQALIKPVVENAARAGIVTLTLKPTPAARAVLKRKHKLRVPVEVAFDPAGGSPRTEIVPVTLKLTPPAPKRR